MVKQQNTNLVIVDVQEKLTAVMHQRESLVNALVMLVKGALILRIPIVIVEQNPLHMGPTIAEITGLFDKVTPVSKMTFSCMNEPRFLAALDNTRRKHVLLAGIESHICIAQTTADLIKGGWKVDVVADAVSSRTAYNKDIGLEKVRTGGGHITCVESALFELLETAAHTSFRDILRLVK